MTTFGFDVTKQLFNVVVVWHSPCAGEPRRESKIANTSPLTWGMARKWSHSLLHGVGKAWPESKFVDAYIEPATCPRPWTPEIQAAFDREMLRGALSQPLPQRDDLIQEPSSLVFEVFESHHASLR